MRQQIMLSLVLLLVTIIRPVSFARAQDVNDGSLISPVDTTATFDWRWVVAIIGIPVLLYFIARGLSQPPVGMDETDFMGVKGGRTKRYQDDGWSEDDLD